MSTDTKHTKGEWIYEKHEVGKYFGNIISHLGKNERGIMNIRTIDIILKHNGEEEADANAKFICKAVNSHEILLDALKDLVAKVEKLSLWDKTDTAYYKAKEAINKAENL